MLSTTFRELLEQVETDDSLSHLERRPETNKQQLTLSKLAFRNAISKRDEASGAILHGSSLPVGFRESLTKHGNFSLVGQTINHHHDLAKLAQVYRDPRYETFHAIYTKGSEVVGHSAITSRLPGVVSFFKDASKQDEHIEDINGHMKNLGADSYWLVHNHPSGLSKPSDADISSTKWLSRKIPGFKGHVIVDHKEYSRIETEDNDYKIIKRDFTDDHASHTYDIDTQEKPHDLIGQVIDSPQSLAKVAKGLQHPGHVTLIGTKGHQGKVSTVASFPEHLLTDQSTMGKLRAKARLKRFAVQTGTQSLFLLVDEKEKMKHFEHLFEDGSVQDVMSHGGHSIHYDTIQKKSHLQLGGRMNVYGEFTK